MVRYTSIRDPSLEKDKEKLNIEKIEEEDEDKLSQLSGNKNENIESNLIKEIKDEIKSNQT